MTESDILTPHQIDIATSAQPHEVLFAIHKRVVDTENLMKSYRTHAQNIEVEIGMLKERILKLEKIANEEVSAWEAIHPTS